MQFYKDYNMTKLQKDAVGFAIHKNKLNFEY